jgi:hypothetical protein
VTVHVAPGRRDADVETEALAAAAALGAQIRDILRSIPLPRDPRSPGERSTVEPPRSAVDVQRRLAKYLR